MQVPVEDCLPGPISTPWYAWLAINLHPISPALHLILSLLQHTLFISLTFHLTSFIEFSPFFFIMLFMFDVPHELNDFFKSSCSFCSLFFVLLLHTPPDFSFFIIFESSLFFFYFSFSLHLSSFLQSLFFVVFSSCSCVFPYYFFFCLSTVISFLVQLPD